MERPHHKPSIQNKRFQSCSKCHSNPLRVNMKSILLGKKNLTMSIVAKNWAAVWLSGDCRDLYIPLFCSVFDRVSHNATTTTTKNTAVHIGDTPVIIFTTAEGNSNILAQSHHIKEKAVQTDILITRCIYFWCIFIKDIIYKMSHVSNQPNKSSRWY